MSMTKKILILAVNPKDTTRLRLDEEAREIEEGLHRSKNREQFSIKARLAVHLTVEFGRSAIDFYNRLKV